MARCNSCSRELDCDTDIHCIEQGFYVCDWCKDEYAKEEKINCLSWHGDKHKFYRKDLEYLKFLAEHKAFYFSDTKLNGILVERKF